MAIATWLLRASVPSRTRRAPIRLAATRPTSRPGRTCSGRSAKICHAYDGGGKTEIGAGQYPRPPALRSMNIAALTDGEIFYHIRNGIRNTGHAGMVDAGHAALAARRLSAPSADCRGALAAAVPAADAEAQRPTRTTSAPPPASRATPPSMTAGRKRGWRMSCAIRRSIRTRSSRISPSPTRCVTFTKDDIAFVYGSKWKQRYFKKVGDDYFPLPAQWDVTHKIWRPYHRAERRGLVGAVLSGRQHAAPDRPALRRLPFGELRHRDQDRRPSGTSAASAATAPAARTSPSRCGRTSSTRRGSTTCTPTTPASSAIRRASR